MCLTPSFVWVQRGPKCEKQEVPCKVCWQCKSARMNDYVGRALAEASTSKASMAVTLTYAPRDDLAERIVHPRHFQLFIKLLRRAGHKIRYIVAAEYGELKGRVHFHAILFFEHIAPSPWGQVPEYNPDHIKDPNSSASFSRDVPHQRMCHIREWPHGHIKADWSASEKSVRYVCKYILADDKNNAWFSLSKKPALGAAFFAAKADEARTLGVLPSSFTYAPPGGSKERRYPITGASRRDYLNAITTDPRDRDRMGEWTLKSFDKLALQAAVKAGETWVRECPEEAWKVFSANLPSFFKSAHDVSSWFKTYDMWNEQAIEDRGSPSEWAAVAKLAGFQSVEDCKNTFWCNWYTGRHLDGSPIRPPGVEPQHPSGCSCERCNPGGTPDGDLSGAQPDPHRPNSGNGGSTAVGPENAAS